MKIAAVTEDGVTISQHFRPRTILPRAHGRGWTHRQSRAAREDRPWSGARPRPRRGARQPHGFDPASQDTHSRMAAPISDCQILLARGMGAGAYASLEQAGIRPILTTIVNIEEAALAGGGWNDRRPSANGCTEQRGAAEGQSMELEAIQVMAQQMQNILRLSGAPSASAFGLSRRYRAHGYAPCRSTASARR